MEFSKIKRKEFDFWTQLQTRWSDMDSMGHINNASYLSYMETARVDFFAYLGLPKINKSLENSVILASSEISYLNQVSHPSILSIGHRICRIGKKSFDLLSGVFPKGQKRPVCVALFKMVSFNYNINKSILIPLEIINNNRNIDE